MTSMRPNFYSWTFALISVSTAVVFATQPQEGHDHHHHHGDVATPKQPPPKIYLDKSERIVQYQLKRLSNERLLQVERKTDDPKYAPVFTAILTREGMSPQYRQEALHGLVTINQSNSVAELLEALKTLKPDDSQQRRIGRQLSKMLMSQESETINTNVVELKALASADNSIVRPVAFAALATAESVETVWQLARDSDESTLDWLQSIPLLSDESIQSASRETVLSLTSKTEPTAVRIAAISALAEISEKQNDTFTQVARLLEEESLRQAAVKTLLRVPPKHRDVDVSGNLVPKLVTLAENTPASERTTDQFLEAMQLADQLLARLPVSEAKPIREKLREFTVRVVVIHTVEEEMRYDIPYFAVEAGRPVQVLLKNEDLMPHNLVVTRPGALQEVAQLGAAQGPQPGFEGKPFVPESDKVLFATGMVQARQQQRLTFTAPKQAGEYPYVCTFPRHWMRMYGVMVVVPDLDEWLQNPVKPKDPIGSNRSFVKSWKVEDFKEDFDQGLRGRTPEIGQKLFAEATCAQCHKVKNQGGAVGPALDDVFVRWKGDRTKVLREILDPSHRIDPKYAVNVVILESGVVTTGMIVAEDKTTLSILANPEAKEPTVVQKSEILEREKTSTSMMPKALLDRFTKEEIFEIFAYLESVQKNP